MLLAHGGEEHSGENHAITPGNPDTQATGQVLTANDTASNGISSVALVGGVIIVLVAAFVTYKFIVKRKFAAEKTSDT